uniref:Uncharacterized protein n=1 Tax=Panagrolaimus sp. ES5 TaxID=591445 RepID=A0AC34G7Y4_9BILA
MRSVSAEGVRVRLLHRTNSLPFIDENTILSPHNNYLICREDVALDVFAVLPCRRYAGRYCTAMICKKCCDTLDKCSGRACEFNTYYVNYGIYFYMHCPACRSSPFHALEVSTFPSVYGPISLFQYYKASQNEDPMITDVAKIGPVLEKQQPFVKDNAVGVALNNINAELFGGVAYLQNCLMNIVTKIEGIQSSVTNMNQQVLLQL